MPKRQMSNADLEQAAQRAEDFAADLRDMADDIRKNLGWDADVSMPATFAAKFAGLSRAAADLTSAMVTRLSFDEDRKSLAEKFKARAQE